MEAEPDYAQLEEYFRALAFQSRLELLHLLRIPRPLSEIRVGARRSRPGETPGRPMARQSLQVHLDKLMEIGVVLARETDAGRGRKEYVINGPRLYQIMEEFRQVGTIVRDAPVGRDATIGLETSAEPAEVEGPHLVLVHGLLEGKVFPLRRIDLLDGRGWVLGRKADLQVSLDYDPYVSLENSEIEPVPDPRGGGGTVFALRDLRGSRNGTSLNWRRLAADEAAPLKAGDVVGLGRSMLVFRP